MPPLRLVFLGSDPIALPLLNWLTGEGSFSADIVAVFTQPDRATGRGQKVQPNAIKEWALARNLPVLQPEKLTPEVRDELASFNADVALVMAYGHILKDDFITTPRQGTLNLHTSLLPKYRGASPIQTAIASGERETGVTLMRIVRKLDAGPIGDVERVPIAPLDTALEVEAKLAAACVPLLARALPQLAGGTLVFTEQNEVDATYCRKLEKEDGMVDFATPAAAIAARINGLFPWPSCTIELGDQPVKLGLADVLSSLSSNPIGYRVDPPTPPQSAFGFSSSAPGTVIGADAAGLLIQAKDGVVRLRRLQRAGGRMLPAGDFLRGFPVPAGTHIDSQPMPPLVETR
jgi:methionyl-tRNA formyltransferase